MDEYERFITGICGKMERMLPERKRDTIRIEEIIAAGESRTELHEIYNRFRNGERIEALATELYGTLCMLGQIT